MNLLMFLVSICALGMDSSISSVAPVDGMSADLQPWNVLERAIPKMLVVSVLICMPGLYLSLSYEPVDGLSVDLHAQKILERAIS